MQQVVELGGVFCYCSCLHVKSMNFQHGFLTNVKQNPFFELINVYPNANFKCSLGFQDGLIGVVFFTLLFFLKKNFNQLFLANQAFHVFSISCLIARRPRMFLVRSVTHMIKAVLKIEGLHGRRHALALLAHSAILTTSTHSAGCKPNFWLNLRFTSWNVARMCKVGKVGDPASHLKKSLTIKSRSTRGLEMFAELHGRSDGSWNSNVLSCAAVSSLISFSLSGKDLMWDSDAMEDGPALTVA